MVGGSVLSFVPRLSLYRHMMDVLVPIERREMPRGRVDVAALREEAARQRSRGDLGAALRTYLQLATVEAENPMHCVRAGDCQLALGRPTEAVELYREAAARFRVAGHARRARATLKRVLELRPDDAAARLALAEMAAGTAVVGAGAAEPPLRAAAG